MTTEILNVLDTGLMMGLLLAGIVMSLGISFRLLNFPDLTIDGSFALGAAVNVAMIKSGYPIVLALITSILLGGIAGILTALLHTKLRINKFLSGIIVTTAIYSVLIRIMHGGNLSFGIKKTFVDYAGDWNLHFFSLGTNLVFLVLAFVIVFTSYLFLRSNYGIRLRAACLNIELAKQVGLNTTLSLMVGLFFTNALASVSGAFFSLKTSYADAGYIQGMLIVSLASLTIGEKIVSSRRLNRLSYILIACLVGSISYQTIWAIALKLDFQPTDLNFITAVIVVCLFIWKNGNKKAIGVELQ